ncbi:cobalamin B12-binding domain-containing protein [Desulfallas sp. Bu1-1]|uniref:cobalamin B12-binding domain-containing protein n=1 Tax=Desulfallas sp. Bu1-1 TaxID=2787620 RepID=UPI0018A01595|nr:cobalamin B12-binding domain-containing protein [Desulfallas sp. Bu1-1]MBF7084512.1 cobalamin B12-binding domain-containing protein [Desulfallas sp. Bu1-1]
MDEKKIKVLVGKPGLDGHDRGAKVVAMALKDAGMEVIYTGLHQSPEQLVRAAIDEDVDVLGLSVLSGIHIGASKRVIDIMKKEGVKDDIILLVGGTIPTKEDVDKLKSMGVDGVFPTDSSFEDIVDFIKDVVKRKREKTLAESRSL